MGSLLGPQVLLREAPLVRVRLDTSPVREQLEAMEGGDFGGFCGGLRE